MTRNGIACQLQPLAPLTAETGSLSWPTPTASEPALERRMIGAKPYRTRSGSVRHRNPDGSSSNLGLAAAVRWPTPRASNAMSARITPEAAHNPKRFPNLETVVGRRTWPTPIARDHRTPKGSKRKRQGAPPLVEAVGGTLNPTWVEWLMGFPLGWTDCEPSATP